MTTSEEERLWYCPRCDRPFDTAEEMQKHLVKHVDYDPELHGSKPTEE